MASPPPAYETTTSPDASSVDTYQKTHLWPTRTALLPSYSTSSPSCWMQKEALEILRTSYNPDAIRLICKFVPGLDPAMAATLLSKRPQSWLDAFLKVLCQRQAVQEPSCDSPLSTAKAIVGITRRRLLSPAPEWNGAWIFSALKSSTDISIIAEKLDAQIHLVFSRITVEDWVAWFYGFPNDPIQSLLNSAFKFRNDLARFVQKHATMGDRLRLLQKVLPSQHPLPHWIVSTAIASNTSSEPPEALRFFIDLIKQLDKEQSSGILSVVRRFSILNTRYELHITFATDVKWPKPFSTDFFFWETIQRDSALDLAKSNTESVSKLYRKLAAEDVLDDSEYMKGIERRWSNLSNNILACLIIDENSAVYFIDLADHLLNLDLELRNVYSAAAIGLALERWRYQPQTAKQSRVWDIINPKDNYTGCRKYMAENAPCLQFLFPYVAELRQSKNASSKIMALFQFLGYFGRREEEVEQDVEKQVVREGAIVNRNSPNYLPSSSPTKRPKRKAAQGPNLEDSQRNNLNTKRRKVGDNPCILQSPRILEGATGGGREIWVIHGATGLRGQFESPKNVNMSANMMACYIAFREEKANEIRALCIKKNCQIFKEACQQMERMLLGVADAPAVALEILSGLTRTQIVLLSCTTIVDGQCFSNMTSGVDSRDWTDKERAAFARKFTSYIAGLWDRERILNDWEELAKVLLNEVWERRLGRALASRGYPSIWAGVEIWWKLDGFQQDAEILRLELV